MRSSERHTRRHTLTWREVDQPMQDTRAAEGDARPLRADARRNRAQILAAARDVFVEHGAGAPLEDISRRAGTGIATLYRRFPDRLSLMRAVVIDALERTIEEARAALAEEPTAFAALVRYMHRTLDVRIAAVIPTLLGEVSMEEEEIRRISDEGTRYLQQIIEAAQADGTLRPDVTFGDVGMMLVRLSRPLPGPIPRELNEQLAHRHLDLLLQGFRTERSERSERANRVGGADRPDADRQAAVEGLTLEDLHDLRARQARLAASPVSDQPIQDRPVQDQPAPE